MWGEQTSLPKRFLDEAYQTEWIPKYERNGRRFLYIRTYSPRDWLVCSIFQTKVQKELVEWLEWLHAPGWRFHHTLQWLVKSINRMFQRFIAAISLAQLPNGQIRAIHQAISILPTAKHHQQTVTHTNMKKMKGSHCSSLSVFKSLAVKSQIRSHLASCYGLWLTLQYSLPLSKLGEKKSELQLREFNQSRSGKSLAKKPPTDWK